MSPRPPLTLLAALLALWSCQAERLDLDPTVILETRGGQELGVSTDYGVVFLGRTARAGPVNIAAWYGDGPSIEGSVIEPIGGGLFVADAEIRLPQVPLSFAAPGDGQEVVVQGRDVQGRWRLRTRIVRHPQVEGLLLEVPSELAAGNEAEGAGIYLDDERGRRRLLGLVSGRLRLFDPSTRAESEYLTAYGPTDLWRLVTFRRDPNVRERLPYREDIR